MALKADAMPFSVYLLAVNELAIHHGGLEPIHKASPELLVVEDDGEGLYALCLRKDKGFGELVHCAHAARHDHIGLCVLYKHELAHEEIAELAGYAHILVAVLLLGKLDAQSNGRAIAFHCTLVACLHDTWAAASDNAKALFSQAPCHFHSVPVLLAVRGDAGRAEDGDAVCRNTVQGVEGCDGFRHDAQSAPGFGCHIGQIVNDVLGNFRHGFLHV